jgi:hypothetical protein
MFVAPHLSLHRLPGDARAGFEPAKATDNRQSSGRLLEVG